METFQSPVVDLARPALSLFTVRNMVQKYVTMARKELHPLANLYPFNVVSGWK